MTMHSYKSIILKLYTYLSQVAIRNQGLAHHLDDISIKTYIKCGLKNRRKDAYNKICYHGKGRPHHAMVITVVF